MSKGTHGIKIHYGKLRKDVEKRYKTFRECAAAAKMPESTLGHVCRGEQDPSKETLGKIAAVLPHTAAYYMVKAETPEKKIRKPETPEQMNLSDYCEKGYKDRLLKALERIANALESKE